MPPLLPVLLLIGLGRPSLQEPHFGGWRILAPLECPGGLGTEVAPEKALASLRRDGAGPDLEKTFKRYDGGRAAWVDLDTDPEAHLDLGARYDTLPEACAFLHRTVRSDVVQRVPILLGSDDGLQLWLNGKEVFFAPESRAHLQGEHRFLLELGPGTNHLVAKVYNLGGAWGFSCQTVPATLAAQRDSLETRIAEAIDRGVANLLARQHLDGSFGNRAAEFPNGHTALALHTLLHCGVPRRHHAVRRATAFLRARAPSKTYSAACQLMAFGELRDPELLPEIEAMAEELLDWERNGYAYPEGAQDLSNTQYAALGLRSAQKAGANIPDSAWRDLIATAERFAARDGGYGYRPGEAATASMTVAGMTVHALARAQLGEALPSRERSLAEGGIAQGLDWFERSFSVHRNSRGPAGGEAGWNYYYLYGIERVAGFLELELFRDRDWYWEGAQRLLKLQEKEGGWPGEPSTCFALLFLRRATQATLSGVEAPVRAETYGDDDPERAVSLRGSGDTPTTLWISSFGDEVRQKYAWGKEEGADLRVRSVSYTLDGEPLARVDGDPSLPTGVQRWPYALRRDDIGRHRVQAEVVLVTPDGADVRLLSNTLELSIDEAPAETLLSYARQRGTNALLGKRLEATSSSQRGNGWAAQGAADGLLSTGWLAAADDRQPRLELVLSRPVRAAYLRLTPAVEDRHDPGRTALATQVAVWVNKRKSPQVVEVTPRLDRKIEVVFDKPENVRQLVVEILARDGETNRSVGWMEVELFP